MVLPGDFAFLPTAVGSLPHTDPLAACALVGRHLPLIPAWPQLPRRGPQEGLYAQFSRGFPGIVERDGLVTVDRRDGFEAALEQFYRRYLEEDLDAFALDAEHAAGFAAFIAGDFPSARAVKGHVIGPVSWGLAVTDQQRRPILYDEILADAAARHLRLQSSWQERALAGLASPTIVFVDEPYLSSFGSAFLAVERGEVQGLLEQVFAGIHGLAGVHCCGNTDWSMLLETSVDILNFDAYTYAETLALYPDALRAFLARGGILAWGIVPTGSDEQVQAASAEMLTERLWSALRLVAAKGIPLETLLAQALLTPACGLATLSEQGAERALALLAEVSSRMRRAIGV